MMQNIAYHILKLALTSIALLPLPILYLLSDALAFVARRVLRYRRALVRKNLRSCFPEADGKWLLGVEKKFYANFADYIVETIKLLHISDKEMQRRFVFDGLEHIAAAMDEHRSVVAYFSHCFNWEWAPSITLHCAAQVNRGDAFCQIYRPLRNKVFDRLIEHIRGRFGSIGIPKSLALRRFLEMRRDGITSVTGFMSDQKPSHGDEVHVVSFLNRRTSVITGTEAVARRLGMAVVYWDIRKPRRGYYILSVVPMADNAANTGKYVLTDQYFKLLQTTVERDPSLWLWTHNRWKNTPKNV